MALAALQHPQVLHRRAHAGVIQVNKMRPAIGPVGGGPQNIAGVAIPMQTKGAHTTGFTDTRLCPSLAHQGEGLLTERRPFCTDFGCHRLLIQQPLARLFTKGLHIQVGAVGKGRQLAHVVDAGQKSANPLQHLGVIQLRLSPAPARADAEPKARVLGVIHRQMVQLLPVQHQRGHHRDVFQGQLIGKGVLLLDRRFRPAQGSVKLGHHARVVVEHGQINPVFIRAQGAQTAVHRQSQIRQSIQHPIG